MPASDGTPVVTPDYPNSTHGVIDNSFIIVVNQSSLDETLEMPLAIVHIDK